MGSGAILPGRIGKFRGSANLSWRIGKLGGGTCLVWNYLLAIIFLDLHVLVIKAHGWLYHLWWWWWWWTRDIDYDPKLLYTFIADSHPPYTDGMRTLDQSAITALNSRRERFWQKNFTRLLKRPNLHQDKTNLLASSGLNTNSTTR